MLYDCFSPIMYLYNIFSLVFLHVLYIGFAEEDASLLDVKKHIC